MKALLIVCLIWLSMFMLFTLLGYLMSKYNTKHVKLFEKHYNERHIFNYLEFGMDIVLVFLGTLFVILFNKEES